MQVARRFRGIVAVALFLLTIGSTAMAQYGGGSGTKDDPYQIWTAGQLNAIGTEPNDWDKHFVVMADIDLKGLRGASFNMIGVTTGYGRPFSGVFNGNGKTISNLPCNQAGATSFGLFAAVQGADALVKNLRLENATVNAGTAGIAGVLVGYLHSGKISRCHADGGSVSGAWAVGGLVGISNGTVVNCSSSASVSVSDISGGGLAGENTRAGNIVKCFSAGRVSARSYAGGIAGQNAGTISDCYSAAETSATKGGAGGITTLNYGIVRNCYSTGKVSAPQIVGGLVGGLRGEGSVADSFWDKQTSGQSTSAGGTGRTTAQLKTAATFAGWDFTHTWTIQEGVDYPKLQWEADPFPTPVATTMEKVSGDSQSGWVGSKAGSPLTVRVRDQEAEPMAGAQVEFSVIAGGGTVEPVSVVTNAGGVASAELTLGPTVGQTQVRAKVGSLSVDFSIEALPLPVATTLEKVSGDNQNAPAGSRTALPLTVRVKDQYGQGMANVPVEFTVLAGGGTLDPVSAATNADGLASTELTLGAAPGANIVGVVAGGLSTSLEAWGLAPGYSGGSGTADDPYRIATAADLITLGEIPEDYAKRFILTADIDLDPNLPGRKVFHKAVIAPDTNDAGPGYQGVSFTGIFDGNDHRISNFSYISQGVHYAGLFGSISYPAEVRNLVLVNPGVVAQDGNCVGTLAGAGGQIFNCRVEGGIVAGKDHVGGLVGSADGMVVVNCFARVAVTGYKQVGGLVGSAGNSGISNCHADGSVAGVERVGGLAGHVPVSGFWAVTDSYSHASVSGKKVVGGLIGSNSGRVINCYSAGRVTGDEQVGGFAGLNEGQISACFWDIETSGTAVSAGGVGKITADMEDVNTVIDARWDFQGEADGPSEIWSLAEDGGYPILWWEVPESRLSPLPAFSGGTGRPDDPYVISTPADITRIGHNPRLMAAHFILANDINLAGADFFTIGSEGIPFTGVFNGNCKQVLNLTYRSTARGCIGFFGRVKGEDAVIKDLGLVDPNIDAGSGDLVGSLVGDNWVATIVNCSVEGGCVRSSGTYVGGLVAYSDGSIRRSYATCDVSGGTQVGGMIGQSDGTITDCYASGNVSGQDNIGGFAGSCNVTTTRCYSTGAVVGAGQHVGGLAGSGSAESCFWDTRTSGQINSAAGTGKTTVEMQIATTFLDAGWDFVGETANGTDDIWSILEGEDYPRLWRKTEWPRASSPDPHKGATDVIRSPILTWHGIQQAVGHDVYFGDDSSAVAAATPETAGIYRGRQTADLCAYSPGALEWRTTYYWRVDEVNDMEPNSPWKGSVWHFTTTACIRSPQPAEGAVNVTLPVVLSWTPGGPDLSYDIYLGETEDAVAEATKAGGGIYRGQHPEGVNAYAPLSLKWGETYYWRIDGVEEAGLGGPWQGDVWSFTTRDFAVSPYPPDGDFIEPAPPVVLRWSAGASDVQQDIYLGEDEAAVAEATPESVGLYRGRQVSEQTTYAPGALEVGKTYYWRIDAVDDADPGNPSQGRVWEFRVVQFTTATVIDDFENYTDAEGSRIFDAWIDGLTNGTGAIVGNESAPFLERTLVHTGLQSVPMDYDNSISPFVSEIQRMWAPPQNWTTDGVHSLALYVMGKAGNSLDRLYVRVQDSAGRTAVAVHPDADVLVTPRWSRWRISFHDLSGVNLTRVQKLTIGVGDRAYPKAGGTGRIYIDDICLMKPMP